MKKTRVTERAGVEDNFEFARMTKTRGESELEQQRRIAATLIFAIKTLRIW